MELDHFRLRLQNPRAAGQCFPALNHNAVFELFQNFRCGNIFNLRPILAFVGVAGMQQAFVPFRLVAQEQQALGIRVQPANRINVFRKTEFRQRAVGRPVGPLPRRSGSVRAGGRKLRNDAIRFVESNEHCRSFQCQVSDFKKIGGQMEMNPRLNQKP